MKKVKEKSGKQKEMKESMKEKEEEGREAREEINHKDSTILDRKGAKEK